MEVVEEETFVEGEAFLIGEIEEELAAKGYTREDLLTSTLLLCARKKIGY
jgi:hypothetical protein